MNVQPEFEAHSIEAEQIVLGTVMLNNDAFHILTAFLEEEHFYDPMHGRIWDAMRRRIDAEMLASPVTLLADFGDDEGLKELGGGKYLVRCAGVATSADLVKHYGREIVRSFQRRKLDEALRAARESLRTADGIELARAQLESALVSMPTIDGRESTVSFLKAVTDAIAQINDAYMGGSVSLKTGLQSLDEGLGGLWPADLVIIGGRPSMGKTALATSIAKRVAERGKKVMIASLEMSESSLAMRLLAESAGLKYSSMRSGALTEAEFRKLIERAKDMGTLPIGFTPPHVQEVASIQAAAKAERARMGGLDLVIVDYLQLLRAPGRGRYEQMTEASRLLKSMAKILNVPVIALAQLSRAVEQRDDKRPHLADLRETGQIEQDADVVMFTFRNEYYLERMEAPKNSADAADYYDALNASKNKVEILIQKQRMGGIYTARLGCHLPTNRFWDLDQAPTEGL